MNIRKPAAKWEDKIDRNITLKSETDELKNISPEMKFRPSSSLQKYQIFYWNSNICFPNAPRHPFDV